VTVLADKHARFAGWGLAAAQAAVSGPIEVAIVGSPDDPATAALHRTALLSSLPGLVVALGEPGSEEVPLLSGRGLVGGQPAAYVCRRFVCKLPVTTPAGLLAELGNGGGDDD
jgi:uncharacterized protein YyaL (SSP411 family)